MGDTVEWRWVDVGGEQYAVRFDELADALATETLPPFVLVWRTGWEEWQRASSAPELVDATHSDRADRIRQSPTAMHPPAPPLEKYAALQASTTTTLYQPKRAEAPQTVPPVRPERPAPPRAPVPGIPAPPAFMTGPIQIRDVMPTLAGEEPVPRSPTLRPSGALPPPPRPMPQSKLPVFDEISEVEDFDPEIPSAPHLPPALPVRTPTPLVASVGPVVESRKPSLPTKPRTQSAPAGRAPSRGVGGLSRHTLTTLTSAGLVLPGGLLLVFALMRPHRHARPDTESATANTSASAQTPRPPVVAPRPVGCVVKKAAVRVVESAFVGTPVLLATTPDGQVAAGFAAAKDRALGITIDPSTLGVTPSFDETVTGSSTLGVVPLVRAGTLSFAVDRPSKSLAFSRTIDAPTRFSIGVTTEGLSRTIENTVDVIWPGKSKNPTITPPRVATVNGTGHVVAFRHGGQQGKILIGWLHEDGSKLTDLKAVGTDAALVGTPTISSNGHAVLVAFASKTAPEEAWRVELAGALSGSLPGHSAVFALPPGGPGGEAISPSSEGLTNGRFLLQWTEGSAGNRAVRVQVLSPDLSPIGDPLTLSTPDQNAGQGALWIHRSSALALYLVKTAASHEIWGASLECP